MTLADLMFREGESVENEISGGHLSGQDEGLMSGCRKCGHTENEHHGLGCRHWNHIELCTEDAIYTDASICGCEYFRDAKSAGWG